LDQVLVKPKIFAYLNEHFIPVRVDFDLEKEIVRRYSVQGVPDLWFLDSQGKRLKRSTGFVPADTLLSILKYINEDAFQNMSFREFLQKK
jgi:thioredoxin-related protein